MQISGNRKQLKTFALAISDVTGITSELPSKYHHRGIFVPEYEGTSGSLVESAYVRANPREIKKKKRDSRLALLRSPPSFRVGNSPFLSYAGAYARPSIRAEDHPIFSGRWTG